ncbi:MAG: glycosyl hydrolase [Thermomicrobiales bacterium]
MFSELWYTWFALTYLALFLLPVIALLTNQPIVRVPFLEFLLFTTPITLVAVAALAWAYRRRWFKPGTHFFISWRGTLLVMARWPIVLIALFNAIVSILFRDGAFNYMVTPKGARAIRIWDMVRVALPFTLLGSVSLASTFLYVLYIAPHSIQPEAAGYILFALISAALFTLLVGLALRDYVVANRRVGASRVNVALRSVPLSATLLALIGGLGLSASLSFDHAADALTYWPGVLSAREETPGDGTAAVLPTATISPTETISEPSTVHVSSWLFDPARSGITFGAYDPSGDLSQISRLEHLFIAWADDEQGGVPIDRIRESYAAGRPVMLSIEPWPIAGKSESSLLNDISAGGYDRNIGEAAAAIASIDQPILIRFGHEMDIDGLYPWATGKPDEYVRAYRHVVDIFRQQGAANILWVWSPAGTLDAPDYYPGNDYVDYVGTTILEYTGWEQEAGFATPRPINALIDEKYRLFKGLDKPLILAEVGIAIEPELKSDRLEELVYSAGSYPGIRAIVYFNDRNPENSASVDRPDWSLSADEVQVLEDAISLEPGFEP